LLPPQLAVVRRGVMARRDAAARRTSRLPAAPRHALVPGESARRSAAPVSPAVPPRTSHARDDLATAGARGVPRRRVHGGGPLSMVARHQLSQLHRALGPIHQHFAAVGGDLLLRLRSAAARAGRPRPRPPSQAPPPPPACPPEATAPRAGRGGR